MKKRPRSAAAAAIRIVILILILGLVGLGLGVYALARAPLGISEAGILVTVEPGASTKTISEELSREGGLRSALVFRVLARALGQEAKLKAGTYRVLPGMGSLAVLELIVSGKQALVRVTVPEGFTLKQTAALMEKLNIASADSVLAAARDEGLRASLGISAPSLEGYLFPDTYFFPNNYPAPDLVRAMVGAFREKVGAALPETLTMAPAPFPGKTDTGLHCGEGVPSAGGGAPDGLGLWQSPKDQDGPSVLRDRGVRDDRTPGQAPS